MIDVPQTFQAIARGHRLANRGALRANRPQVDAILDRRLAAGKLSPWWGKGWFVRHIALGLLEPTSLCARHMSQVSSAPMPTPLKVLCPTCSRIWKAAVTRNHAFVDAADERAIRTLADEFDDLIGAGNLGAARARWAEVSRVQPVLSREARNRLDERGVDVGALIEGARPTIDS